MTKVRSMYCLGGVLLIGLIVLGFSLTILGFIQPRTASAADIYCCEWWLINPRYDEYDWDIRQCPNDDDAYCWLRYDEHTEGVWCEKYKENCPDLPGWTLAVEGERRVKTSSPGDEDECFDTDYVTSTFQHWFIDVSEPCLSGSTIYCLYEKDLVSGDIYESFRSIVEYECDELQD